MMIENVLEIIVGAVIVALLFVVSNWCAQADGRTVAVIQSDSLDRLRVRTMIVDGYTDGVALRNRAFDTCIGTRPNYIEMGSRGGGDASGGTTFSYSFWAYIDNPGRLPPEGLVLFLKGDPTVYTTYVSSPDLTSASGVSHDIITDVVVKSPMVTIRKNPDTYVDILIEVNTNVNPHASMLVTGSPNDDPTMRHNVTSLVVGSWSLWTVTAADHIDEDSRAVGFVLSFYINQLLIASKFFENQSVRPNQGDLILFPAIRNGVAAKFPTDEALANVHIADMMFSTQPLTLLDLQNRLSTGISNKPASIASTRPIAVNVLNLSGQNIINTANF